MVFTKLVDIFCKLVYFHQYTYIHTDMDDFIVRPLAPPPLTHTSDRPIFKNSHKDMDDLLVRPLAPHPPNAYF